MSHFAKRHYEAIAEAIQWAKKDVLFKEPDSSHKDMLDGIDLLRDHLVDMFKSDNGQFDKERFKFACEPGRNIKARTAHLS